VRASVQELNYARLSDILIRERSLLVLVKLSFSILESQFYELLQTLGTVFRGGFTEQPQSHSNEAWERLRQRRLVLNVEAMQIDNITVQIAYGAAA
jgi:hypothetical protein